MRIVFMGTPEFSVASLKALLQTEHEIVGVFTQPDRPVGRGHKIEKSPVKILAEENNLPVYQFERVSKQEGLDTMRAIAPDLIVTAAFGQILSRKLLAVPKMGTINVHASLLPKHRGAAPINQSIMMGETVTGVTTMLTDAGLDTGDILLKREVAIGENETAGELTERLALVGAELLTETLPKYFTGEIKGIPQNEAESTYEPMMSKETGKIDFAKSAREINWLVRGVNPWPGAYTTIGTDTMKVWGAVPANIETASAPGTVLAASAKEGLLVACAGGAVEITELQMPGGKRMSAKAYLSGRKIPVGTVLGEENV